MQRLQQELKDACDNSTGEVNFYANYSGRGMYGRTCVGITGTRGNCQRIMATVLKDMGWRIGRVAKESKDPDYSTTAENLHETMENFEAEVEQLMDFAWDSMGHGVIVYWPNLEPLVDAD